jgi:hypothetical protein
MSPRESWSRVLAVSERLHQASHVWAVRGSAMTDAGERSAPESTCKSPHLRKSPGVRWNADGQAAYPAGPMPSQPQL